MMKNKVILDTEIGSDIDDAYALVFALNSPEIKLKAIITNNSNVKRKAQIARTFTKEVPIFAGIENNKGFLTTTIGDKEYEPENLRNKLSLFKEKGLTYISIGALSNLAFFLENGIKFDKVVIMGGSLNVDYCGENKRITEWNLNCDLNATKRVFNSNLNILLVPLDATWNLKLTEEHIKKIKEDNKRSSVLLTQHLIEMREFLFKKFGILNKQPVLHDPLAVYASFGTEFISISKKKLTINDNGILACDENGKEMYVVNQAKKEFIDFFMERILND